MQKKKELLKKQATAAKKNTLEKPVKSLKSASKTKSPGSKKTVGQVSARNKKNQAKRDKR